MSMKNTPSLFPNKNYDGKFLSINYNGNNDGIKKNIVNNSFGLMMYKITDESFIGNFKLN